jgi:MFS family permease
VTLGIAPVLAPTVAGILFSVVACSAAVGHHLSGHALKRLAPRTVIGWGCAAAAAAAVVMSFVQGVVPFGVATGLFGVAIGMTMTSAYTAAGLVVPAGAHGTAFGLLASASLGGIALGPSVSGVIGGFDLRWVFLADALILAGVLISVLRLMRSRGHLRP